MSLEEEDFDFDLSPLHKQSSPKKGRRSIGSLLQPNFQRSNDEDDIGNSDDLLVSPATSPDREGERYSTAKPRRRTGGWADEIPKSGKNRKGFMQDVEDERLRAANDDSDNDLPLIPDLDEVQEEDMAQQVAQAPHVAVNRVATYKELDSDLLKHAAFATLDNIDLRILMKCLAPEAELKEADEPWTWDVLFTEVTSELQSEWEIEDNDETIESA